MWYSRNLGLDVYSGTTIVASAFLSFFIVGNSGISTREGTTTALPYVFAGCMIIIDAAFRAYSWRFGHALFTSPSPSGYRLTRRGVITTPGKTTLPLPEALFSPMAGGRVWFIPVWLVGLIILAIATGYDLGWFNSFPAPTPRAFPR